MNFNDLAYFLQQNSLLLAKLLDDINEAIFIADKTGSIKYFNSEFSRILGFDQDKINSMTVIDINPDFKGDKWSNHCEIIKKQNSLTFESFFLNAKHHSVPVEINSSYYCVNDQEYIVGLVKDVSERNELLKLNRLYQTLSACNESLIHTQNENLLLQQICNIIVNKGKYRLAWVGLAENDIYKSVKPIAYAGTGSDYIGNIKLSWEDNEFGNGPTGKAIRNKKMEVFNYYSTPEFSTWRQEAEKHGYQSSAAFPLIVEDDVLGALNIYSAYQDAFNEGELNLLKELTNDLAYGIASIRSNDARDKARNLLNETQSELSVLNQNLEKRVKERTSQLESLNKELEAFSYSVSHDLRNPLHRIKMYLELLKENDEITTESGIMKSIESIYSSILQMDELIDNILYFSRMSHQNISFEDINTSDLIHDIIEEFEPDIVDRVINWNIANLPIVKGDKNLLRLVFINLISNALKFTSKNSETIIVIGYFPNKNENIIFIRDNGVGFDMNNADKLFGVFQRLHSQKEFPGTGVGLSNVRRIIERHGGHIWAEGELDKGSTFYVSLPSSSIVT